MFWCARDLSAERRNCGRRLGQGALPLQQHRQVATGAVLEHEYLCHLSQRALHFAESSQETFNWNVHALGH